MNCLMLILQIDRPREIYNDVTEEFVTVRPCTIKMEHSLLAIARWEEHYHIPYLTKEQKTGEQIVYYLQSMVLNPEEADFNAFYALTKEEMERIQTYISDVHTATTVTHRGKKGNSGEQITSELIYYWMSASQIPYECETWNINRLLKLIEVASVKNGPQDKMSKRAVLEQQHALNQARRAKLGSKG